MNNLVTDTSRNKAVRVAGLMFLLSFALPSFNWIFIVSKFNMTGDAVSTARNVLANEALFRIGIVNEIITSIILVVLGLALYIVLKSVNKNLALLALLLKLTEAILWAIVAGFGHFIALLILKNQSGLTATESMQMYALVGAFLNEHLSVTTICGVFLGLNSTIYAYLLFKSNYVPKLIAGFGVVSYLLILIYDLMVIVLPDYGTFRAQAIWGTPSILFTILIGFWFLIKGIRIPENVNSH